MKLVFLFIAITLAVTNADVCSRFLRHSYSCNDLWQWQKNIVCRIEDPQNGYLKDALRIYNETSDISFVVSTLNWI